MQRSKNDYEQLNITAGAIGTYAPEHAIFLIGLEVKKYKPLLLNPKHFAVHRR